MKKYKKIYETYGFRSETFQEIDDYFNCRSIDELTDNFRFAYVRGSITDLTIEMLESKSESVSKTFYIDELYEEGYEIGDEDVKYACLNALCLINDDLVDGEYNYDVEMSKDYRKICVTIKYFNPNEQQTKPNYSPMVVSLALIVLVSVLVFYHF